MDIIKHKLATAKHIIEELASYNDKLFPLLEGKSASDKQNIIGISEKFTRHFKNIDLTHEEYKSHASLVSSVNFYKSYIDLSNDLKNIMDIYNQPFNHPEQIDGSDLSQTYKLTTGDMLHDLLNEYNKYCVKYQNTDQEFIDFLIHRIINDFDDTKAHLPQLESEYLDDDYDDVDDDSDEVNELNKVDDKEMNLKKISKIVDQMHDIFLNDLSVLRFYVAFMQYYMDYLYDSKSKDAKKLMFNMIALLEQSKDKYLASQITNSFESSVNKKINKDNPSLTRFDMLPITECMPIDQLMHKISKGHSNTTNLNKYAKDHNACFIVAHKVVITPVEYNIQPLISYEIAKPLMQKATVGITQKIIKRFRTIKIPDGKKIFYKWNFAYELIGDENKADVFYVVSTLDNVNYRLMAPWLDVNNFALPKFRVSKILDYINNDNKPTRAAGYHTMSAALMAKNMFLRKPLPMDDIDEKSMELDTQLIRNKLFMEQMNRINDKVQKSKLHDDSDINEIIHDDELRTLFRNIILEMYSSGTNSKFDGGRFSFSELLASFLVDLDALVNRFMKELHDGYNRNLLPKTVFKEPKPQKVSIISKKLEEILLKALMTVLSDKENIYSSINYKYLLLNFH